MGKYRSPLLTIWRRRAFFDLKERGTGRMTEMQMLPEQIRIVFDAVLQIDLQNGTYKTEHIRRFPRVRVRKRPEKTALMPNGPGD